MYPGNVLLACKRCNGEKRRDDSLVTLHLAASGWESFLSHDGRQCPAACLTCIYWQTVWPVQGERVARLRSAAENIKSFRGEYPQFQRIHGLLQKELPKALAILYTDCQKFAGARINSLMDEFLSRFPLV